MPRAPKKCGKLDCEERVVARTYCPVHEAEQQKRPKTAARGYGNRHKVASQAARAALVDGTPCARCGEPMYRSQRIALDHADDDRSTYLGLSHARCNDRAGGVKNQQPATRA
jgi:hypothetical protein